MFNVKVRKTVARIIRGLVSAESIDQFGIMHSQLVASNEQHALNLWFGQESEWGDDAKIRDKAVQKIRNLIRAEQSNFTTYTAAEKLYIDVVAVLFRHVYRREWNKIVSAADASEGTKDFLAPVETFLSNFEGRSEGKKVLRLLPELRPLVVSGLRTLFQKDVLSRGEKAVGSRRFEFADVTTRDGPQSNLGTCLEIGVQTSLIESLLESGTPVSRIEATGGAIFQHGLLREVPIDGFKRNREIQVTLCRSIDRPLEQLGVSEDEDILEWRQRFFEPTEGNRPLNSAAQLEGLLLKKGLDHEDYWFQEAIRLADILITSLMRSYFAMGLFELHPSANPEIYARAFNSGADVQRIFDAFNRETKLKGSIEAATRVGSPVQIVVHVDPENGIGVGGYVSLARRLVDYTLSINGIIDAVYIKDAPGRVPKYPEFGYDLSAAFTKMLAEVNTDKGLDLRLGFHTHDTHGDSQVALFEFLRGALPEVRVIMDFGLGENALSSPFGNPDLIMGLKMYAGTAWFGGPEYKKAYWRRPLERLAAEIVERFGRSNEVPTWLRQLAVDAGLPGGMAGSFEPQVRKYLNGVAGKVGILDSESLYLPFFRLVLERMKDFNLLMGLLNRVTPVANWCGFQGLTWANECVDAEVVVFDDNDKVFRIRDTGNPDEVKKIDTAKLFKQFLSPVPPFQGYLMEWVQSSELQELYPGADVDLLVNNLQAKIEVLAKAYDDESLPLPDRATLLNWVSSSPGRAKIQENIAKIFPETELVRERLERQFIDATVVNVTASLVSDGKRADAINSMSGDEIATQVNDKTLLSLKALIEAYEAPGRSYDHLLLAGLFQDQFMGVNALGRLDEIYKMYRTAIRRGTGIEKFAQQLFEGGIEVYPLK